MKISNVRKTKGGSVDDGEFFFYRCDGLNLYYKQVINRQDCLFIQLDYLFGEEAHDYVEAMEGWAFTIQEINDLKLQTYELKELIENIILDSLGVE